MTGRSQFADDFELSLRGTVPFHIDFSALRAAQRIPAYRRALAATDPSDTDRRAALLAALSVAESITGQGVAPTPDGETTSLTRAQDLARATGSPRAELYVLMARYAIDLSPEALPARVDLARRIVDVIGDDACADLRDELLPVVYFMYLGALMESGDVFTLDRALSPELHQAGLFTPVLHGRYAMWLRSARAAMDGHLTLAERLANEAHEMAVTAADVDADAVWMGQIAIIRWMQGRVSEMEQVFLTARQSDPDEPVWAAAVAWIWTHQGRTQASRGLIEALPDVDTFTRGRNWLAAVSILAEVAAEVGSDAIVERLRRALEPFADRLVPIGLGVTCWGTVARPLALLAHRQGRRADALRLYRLAVQTSSRIGAQAWLAQAQVELAALLFDDGDVVEARALTLESAAAARHLGLRSVEQRADRLLGRIDRQRGARPNSDQRRAIGLVVAPAHVSASDPASGDGAPVSRVAAHDESRMQPRITVLGRFSVIGAGGSPAEWKSRKARTLLKVLIARRGAALARESAMDLLWPGQDPDTLRNRLSVAITTVRRALDPDRLHPPDAFLVADVNVLRLRLDRLFIDVEHFLQLSNRALAAPTNPARPAGPDGSPEAGETRREDLLRRAIDAYTGDAFASEPYAPWAEQLRRQAHLAYFALAHASAEHAADAEDHFRRAELYRQILAADPYDQRAHDGLIDALTTLGATAHISSAHQERRRRMAELGLPDTAS